MEFGFKLGEGGIDTPRLEPVAPAGRGHVLGMTESSWDDGLRNGPQRT